MRLALALLTPAFSACVIGTETAHADEITSSGLETVVVQSYLEDPAPVAEVEATAEEEVVMPPAASEPPAPVYEEYVPAPVYQSPSCNCCTKDDKAAATAAMKSAYAGVFYGNNFSYLKDPCYDGPSFWGDCLKNMDMPLGTLSLGGETRFRYHNERNHRGVGITGRDDNFWLSRQRLFADWKVCDELRFYGEVLDANSSGEFFGPRPIEENDLDIQNLFVDVKLLDGDMGKFTLRVGRQELLYGAQRTISPLDWANTRRTFEGIRGLYQNGDTSLDAFWTMFVPVDPDSADEANEDIQFYGLYATQKNTGLGTLEAYYLGFDNTIADFSYHTIGSRVSGKTDSGFLYDLEGAFQFGDNANAGDDDHSAAFITAGIGRKFETDFLSPTVWFYYDWASGEEDFAEAGRGDGGYDHLFPLAHKYNGFMDLFGRRNLHDINVFSATPLGDKVTMILWYHYFMLDQDTTPYSVVMTPYETTTQAQSRDLGHEIDVAFNINLCPRKNILIGYSHFTAGDYYDDPNIGPADEDNDADFFYSQFQMRY